MNKIELEVETVTPLFIAGADTRCIGNEGLRPPSIKGLMRWWFRAILGGMVEIDELKKKEDEIFGFTKQKSKIKILSSTNAQLKKSKTCIQFKKENFPKYLWFPFDPSKKEKEKGEIRYYYPEKSIFKIFLYSRESTSFRIASGALWALIYLGGVGSRSRRGAGSLKINKKPENSPYNFAFNGKTLNETKEFIEDNLSKLFKEFKKLANGDFNLQENVKFPVLSKKDSEIELMNYTNSWRKSLMNIQKIYKDFRDKEILKKVNFGLPININIKENKENEENDMKYKGDLRNIEKKLGKKYPNEEVKKRMKLIDKQRQLRYASPFCIGVMDLNGRYSTRIVKFKTSTHPYNKFNEYTKTLEKDLNSLNSKIKPITTIEIPEVE